MTRHEYVIACSDLKKATKLANNIKLHANQWLFVENTSDDPVVYRRVPAKEVTKL
jgi:hypothetical protein